MRAATAFLCGGDRVLLLRRSDAMPTMPGLWSAVSGAMEGNEHPWSRARAEVKEETGIERVRPAHSCAVSISDKIWVYSVICMGYGRVRLNCENAEYRWVRPLEVASYRTVPCLPQILFLLLGSVGALSGEHDIHAGAAAHRARDAVSGMLAGAGVYEGGLFGVY